METPNYRKGSIIFDNDTILQVEQRGGGGSGVGGETGLAAVNLITGESTNAALAEKDETIEEQASTIEQQAGTISDLEDEVAAKQAIIDAFPAIEALNVTANGTYSEEGKAYSPVNVNVSGDNPKKQIWNIYGNIINNAGTNVTIVKPEIKNANPLEEGYFTVSVKGNLLSSGSASITLGCIGGYYDPSNPYAYRTSEFCINVPKSRVSVDFPSDWRCQLSNEYNVFPDGTRFKLTYLANNDIDTHTPGVSINNPIGTITLSAT